MKSFYSSIVILLAVVVVGIIFRPQRQFQFPGDVSQYHDGKEVDLSEEIKNLAIEGEIQSRQEIKVAALSTPKDFSRESIFEDAKQLLDAHKSQKEDRFQSIIDKYYHYDLSQRLMFIETVAGIEIDQVHLKKSLIESLVLYSKIESREMNAHQAVSVWKGYVEKYFDLSEDRSPAFLASVWDSISVQNNEEIKNLMIEQLSELDVDMADVAHSRNIDEELKIDEPNVTIEDI